MFTTILLPFFPPPIAKFGVIYLISRDDPRNLPPFIRMFEAVQDALLKAEVGHWRDLRAGPALDGLEHAHGYFVFVLVSRIADINLVIVGMRYPYPLLLDTDRLRLGCGRRRVDIVVWGRSAVDVCCLDRLCDLEGDGRGHDESRPYAGKVGEVGGSIAPTTVTGNAVWHGGCWISLHVRRTFHKHAALVPLPATRLFGPCTS